MQNRIRSKVTRPTASVLPMPGRLSVSYRDWAQRIDVKDVPLAQVPTGTLVHAAGTITAVVHLPGGRAMAVISSDDQHSAHVLLTPDVVRMVAPALYRGNRLNVRGTVTRTTPGQPAGIDGRGIQVEVV
jgi:hypothetical protein